MQKKLCGMCNETRAIERFSPDKKTTTGFRWSCKDCEKIRRRKSYIRNRENRIESTKKYRAKEGNYRKHLDYQKHYRNKTREKFFEIYGDKCACCGELGKVFLTLDHINGGGCKERRINSAMSTYRRAIKNIDHTEFRTLCMNCNYATRFGKDCPHTAAKQTGE